MAHCVIILQPLWILIKKNSKWEEKENLRAKSGFRIGWCVFFSARTDLRPKTSSRDTDQYKSNVGPFSKCCTARSTSKPLSTIFLLTQVQMSHSPKRIGSLINWVRCLFWGIQRCECCNRIMSFKSRKWVSSLWAFRSELAYHWPVNPARRVAGKCYHFFTLAPFFPSWRVITERWQFCGPSRCAVAPVIIYSCIERESIVIPAVIHLYLE